MPTISYDGQAFILDGRKTWLVSGAIHYPRTPRELWPARIRAAKQAGLNCIETYVFWNVHEPAPGKFNFSGDADLRHFIELVAKEGMYCIVRPGPFICAEWDFGGFPAWLHRVPEIKLREANGPFLAACARYLGAVMDQIRDLQFTASREPGGATGPVIMMQAENEWFSSNQEQAEPYLRELVRYLRENGCEVPVISCNNLWQRVDGTIDTWNACEHLAFNLRQLRAVQPDAPVFVSEYWPGNFDGWGSVHHTASDAQTNLYRLGQILGAGAMYNCYMFHGGTNFGFFGGRSINNPACFITTSYDYDAPLLEAGGRGPKYMVTKRVSTFASQFGQLFANLEPANHSAVAPEGPDHPLSVIQLRGSQGALVFLLKSAKDKTEKTHVLLPNGQNLPVPIGEDRAAWFVLDANLAGVADLTFTNLRPWAFIGKRMLVLFGPAGADGIVSLNDSPFIVKVPEDRAPFVEIHEDIAVVVLNHDQIDSAYITPTGLVFGAAGLDENNAPLPLKGWSITTIGLDGKVAVSTPKIQRKSVAPALNNWAHADLKELINGTSPTFEPIAGPASHEALSIDYGYAWYRLQLPKPTNGKPLLAPESGDRLHFFVEGKNLGVLGLGPGAKYDPTPLKLQGSVVVLSDNLGRFNFGWGVGEKKGLFGHLHAAEPIKLSKPSIADSFSPDPFTLKGFVLGVRRGERRPANEATWSFKLTAKRPIILDIQGLEARFMIYVNGKTIGMYDNGLNAWHMQKLIAHSDLKIGVNELKFAFFDKLPTDKAKADPTSKIKLFDAVGTVTQDAKWSVAKWTVPAFSQFEPLKKGVPSGPPRWYRANFSVKQTDEPLWLEPKGLTKGQLFLNGHNIGRYFVETADGKPVPPQSLYYLPEPWIKTDGPNELVIFDEHGHSPAACKLVYNAMGPYNR